MSRIAPVKEPTSKPLSHRKPVHWAEQNHNHTHTASLSNRISFGTGSRTTPLSYKHLVHRGKPPPAKESERNVYHAKSFSIELKKLPYPTVALCLSSSLKSPPVCFIVISVPPSTSAKSTVIVARDALEGSSVIVFTSLVGRATSRYSPTHDLEVPSGSTITALQLPPSRASIFSVSSGTGSASLPNQTEKCSGLTHASNTFSGDAANVRVMVIAFDIVFGFLYSVYCRRRTRLLRRQSI